MNSIIKGVSRLLAIALAAGGVACAGEKGSKVEEVESQIIENKVEEKKEQNVNESKKYRMKVIKTTSANGKQETTEVEVNDPEECDKVMKEMNLGECFGAFKNFSDFGSSAYCDFLDNFVFDDLMFGGLGLRDYLWCNVWLNSFFNSNGKKQNNVDSKDKAGESAEGKENKSSDEEKSEKSNDASAMKSLDVPENDGDGKKV